MATPVVSLPVPAVVGTGKKKHGFGKQIQKTNPSTFTMTGHTCDQRLQWIHDGLPFADWSVDKVQKVGFGVTGVQVGRFTGVNHRSAAHRHIHIKRAIFGKRDCVFETAAKRRFSEPARSLPEHTPSHNPKNLTSRHSDRDITTEITLS